MITKTLETQSNGREARDHNASIHQWLIRPGFDPRSSHTKDSKNGT